MLLPPPPILNELADLENYRSCATASLTPSIARRKRSLLMTYAPESHIFTAHLLTPTRSSSHSAASAVRSTVSTTGCPPSAPRPLADTVPALMRRRSERHAPSLLFSFHVVHVHDDTMTWDGWTRRGPLVSLSRFCPDEFFFILVGVVGRSWWFGRLMGFRSLGGEGL